MIRFTNKENLPENIENEVQIINSYLSMQTALTEQLAVFINSKINKVDVDKSVVNLNRLKHNISLLNNLIDILDNLKKTMNYLTDDGLKIYLEDYNSLYSNYITTTFTYTAKIEEFIHNLSLEMTEIPSATEEKSTTSNELSDNEVYVSTNSESAYNSLVDNTLVISEIRKEVILPYDLENVKLYFKNNSNKYLSINEVIKELYTFPIAHFKPFAVSRFREAYRLIKQREYGSRINAISLALEMLVNYNVHPAIIASCKNVDELDIYLSCLDDNQLGNFDKFKIRYEIPPSTVKSNKKVSLLSQIREQKI